MSQLSSRKRIILQALKELGGSATTHQIAFKTGLNTNGVSQTLGAMQTRDNLVTFTGGGNAAKDTWRLKSAETT